MKTVFIITKLVLKDNAVPDEVVTEMDYDCSHEHITDYEIVDMVDQYEDLEMSEKEDVDIDDTSRSELFIGG